MLFPYLSRFRNYTEKRQITGRKYSRHFTKQVRNKIYKRTKSERKTLFFRILLFIDWNIIVYDQTEESLVKPYTHFMCIGSTWMHTLHKLNWLLARVVKLLNNFWTGVTYSFSPYSFFPPEKWVYTSFSPGKISIYSFSPPERSVYTHLSPWFLGGKSEYILKFPPHTQFSPFALIDYARAITPIRGSTLWRLL